ncbi:MAG: Wzz/FepE/Etk N-terminal domain-containing protein [Proteobacteria bacterium]|nr:Wzz/FepE/Etk N-terminal domain-containing protein [Pseudomonadota bacterium]
MTEVRTPYDDEIDLFELFETIWRGKWLISALVAISVLSGFVYSQLTPPKFEVSVSFKVNLYSVNAQQICNGNVDNVRCIVGQMSKLLMVNLDSDWLYYLNFKNKNSNLAPNLALSTESPLNVKTYDDVFDKLNQTITNQIYNEALDELTLIKTELNDALMSTERVATNILNATRIIKAIDSGQKAISFGSVAIKKISPKVPLILALSIILGGMIGIVFVLVNNSIRKRKEIASKV